MHALSHYQSALVLHTVSRERLLGRSFELSIGYSGSREEPLEGWGPLERWMVKRDNRC